LWIYDPLNQPSKGFEPQPLLLKVLMAIIDAANPADAMAQAAFCAVGGDASTAHEGSGSTAQIMDLPTTHPAGFVNRCLVAAVATDSLLAIGGEHAISVPSSLGSQCCGVGDHVFHVSLFVVRSGASSRSAIGRLIVNGKKPLNFRELAINFAHFQSHHRQQHDDAGQSHRKSNHMLNRCLHLLVLYRLAAAASNP
jgi:hypothetical protein